MNSGKSSHYFLQTHVAGGGGGGGVVGPLWRREGCLCGTYRTQGLVAGPVGRDQQTQDVESVMV